MFLFYYVPRSSVLLHMFRAIHLNRDTVIMECLTRLAGPTISTVNGSLVISMPNGTAAMIQWLGPDGTALGPAAPIATLADLAAMRAELLLRIGALEDSSASTSVALQNLNASMAQSGDVLAANISGAASSIAAFGSQLATTTTSLSAAVATRVDLNNLTTITTFVRQTVLDMVAPNVTNDLSLQLAARLTDSPTCSCFDPRSLTVRILSYSRFIYK